MKRLIFIRHAKSSWATFQKDIDRPLEERGVKDAHLMVEAIRKFLPDTFLIQSSIAKRAYETAIIIAIGIDYPVENILLNDAQYTFEGDKLEAVVRALSDSDENVILFGHNEAITNFVNKFGDVFIDNVSTCGFVSLEFDTNHWQDISKGRTVKTIFPRDLK